MVYSVCPGAGIGILNFDELEKVKSKFTSSIMSLTLDATQYCLSESGSLQRSSKQVFLVR